MAAVSLNDSTCELLANGRRLLHGRHYAAARRALRRCLETPSGRDAPADPAGRASAYLLLTLATIARARPEHRRVDEIVAMAGYLVAGAADPLAPVLAALLCDDTDAGGIREDPDLATTGWCRPVRGADRRPGPLPRRTPGPVRG